MDRDTIDVYDSNAAAYVERRTPNHDRAQAFGRRVGGATTSSGGGKSGPAPGPEPIDPVVGPVVDLGCGPGWCAADLGPRPIALDASAAMLALVPRHAPDALRVQADLAHLPFRRHSLRGGFASKSYVHVDRRQLPMAWHDLHRVLAVGALAEIVVFTGDTDHDHYPADDFPGRRFSSWPRPLLVDVLEGAGFTIDELATVSRDGVEVELDLHVTRQRTLADTVGPDLRLLVCGLNPSLYAADVGAGFARPGNRFWPAAMAAGLVSRPHDPVHALRVHDIGMTDLVKRASPRADDLTRDEYRHGLARLDRLARWLQPAAICFVGLAGWRAAVDRQATAGPQPQTVGDRPVYVMPNTSGVNASSSLADLTAHLRAALDLAGS